MVLKIKDFDIDRFIYCLKESYKDILFVFSKFIFIFTSITMDVYTLIKYISSDNIEESYNKYSIIFCCQGHINIYIKSLLVYILI